MNVQISIVLWTVICFGVLCFVLKYLLFDPVLALIARREKKIADVKAASAEAARLREQALQEAAEEREKQIEYNQQSVQSEAEKVIAEGKIQLDEARKKRIETVDRFRDRMQEEYTVETAETTRAMNAVTDAFFSKYYTADPASAGLDHSEKKAKAAKTANVVRR